MRRAGKSSHKLRTGVVATVMACLVIGIVTLGSAERVSDSHGPTASQLEAALAVRGVPRPTGTPPRAHALALTAMGHPVGNEALALTELYLAARFGRETLGSDERREFTRRVRALRAQRAPNERAAA